MMRGRANLPLLTGVVLSVALHGLGLLPFFVTVLTSSGEMYAMPSRFHPEDFRLPEEERPEDEQRPPEEDEQMMLGIDESEQSTLSWIGYDEYEKHLADLAEIEQAAFAQQTPGAASEQEPASGGAPPATETEAEEPIEEPVEEPAEPETAQPTDTAQVPVADPAILEPFALPVLRQFTEAAVPIGKAETETEKPDEAPEPKEEPKDEPPKKPAEAPPVKPAPPAPQPGPPTEQKPDKPPAESPADPTPADQADKESDATSVIEVAVTKLGKPIAREGLELKPRRPRFATLTKLTAAPGNPLVEISFGRDGVPANARILQSSGDGRIDHGIRASLFRWRAKGKKLAELGPKETHSVRLRIVLNPRAR